MAILLCQSLGRFRRVKATRSHLTTTAKGGRFYLSAPDRELPLSDDSRHGVTLAPNASVANHISDTEYSSAPFGSLRRTTLTSIRALDRDRRSFLRHYPYAIPVIT